MRKAIFGEPVTAADVERLPSDDRAVAFVRLCGAVIGAALAERAGSFVLPDISERIDGPDGGVDASYTAPADPDVPEAFGLVGPGRTVYQFKYRDPAAATRGDLVNRVARALREELGRALPDAGRYVLMTNLDLSLAHRKRLREALIEAHPSMASKVIVVWGAAEIAQALNATPRLRHVFFSGSGLCTLDAARDELRAAYEPVGWPAFVGRQDQRKAIESFAEDPQARYLEVVGTRYSGRTRLVIEALEKHGAAVIWASEPELATLDVFRDLDSPEPPGILVVDGCTPATLPPVRDRALSRRRLKTIAISTGGRQAAWWAERGAIVVGRLPHGDAASVIRSVLPRVPALQESWVSEAAGGLPGLVLHIAALLRDGALLPASDPDDVERRLGSLLCDQYTRGLSPDAQNALAAASLLSSVGVEGEVKREIDDVSSALGIGAGTYERARGELEDRGLVRRRGRFIEVVPPRLAEEVASRRIRSSPEMMVAELGLRLTAGAFLRFLTRLRSLPDDASTRAIASFLGPGGWFKDLEALKRGMERFETLAPAAPEQALGCLERLLAPLRADELARIVTADFRGSVVLALDELALGSRTFAQGARLLLALAEAGDEGWSGNAAGTFVSLLHWNHPEVSAPLPVRQEVLEEAAGSGSAARRAIAAKACGAAFSEHEFVVLHHARGPAVPEGPGRPRTWGEVRSYGEGVLAILGRLIVDPDAVVRDRTVTSLLQVVQPFVTLSLLPDGFHSLGASALDILERVGREAGSARQRSRVVSHLQLVEDNLRRLQKPPQGAVGTALERVRSLVEVLTAGTLKDRLWHWVGPRSWGQEVDEQGPEVSAREIHGLAARLVAEPEALLDELPWLTSEDAEHRTPLFRGLGRLDRGERLLGPLLAAPGGQFRAQAVAAYVQGWHEAEPDRAGRGLDSLIASRPDLSAAILAATTYLPTSHETVGRVLRIIGHRRLSRPELARQVAFGLAWDRLATSDAESLIAAIDDQTTDTRSALLRAIWLRLVRGAEISAGLEALGWSFLESSLPVRGERDWGWDALAARLGQRDSKRLLVLFRRLMQESASAGRSRFQVSNDLPLTWKTLLREDRQGVLEVLLELSLAHHRPSWLAWTLSNEIQPEEDRPTLLAFAERKDIEGARIVAELADPEKPGFWGLARELVARWGEDQQLAASLASRTLTGPWSGGAAAAIDSRMRAARELTSDPEPKVVRWARAVLADLEEWRKSAAREDREDWIWDQPISRAELEGALERRDAPERLWAIGRLLAHAPEARVRELLTPEDILDALPGLAHLDERTRRKWETWARHWSRAD